MSERAYQVDLLTGAFNQERFEQTLARAVAESNRSNPRLVLLHVDLDDMQEHNDVRGREAMDAALGRVAEKLSELPFSPGPIGRLDGDSFEVFLACSLDEGLKAAEQLREQIESLVLNSPQGPFSLTVSVGVAALKPNEPWGNLAEAARAACDKAKHGGRNMSVCR